MFRHRLKRTAHARDITILGGNENKGSSGVSACIDFEFQGSLVNEIHLPDWVGRQTQEEITVEHVERYSKWKIALTTHCLEVQFQGLTSRSKPRGVEQPAQHSSIRMSVTTTKCTNHELCCYDNCFRIYCEETLMRN